MTCRTRWTGCTPRFRTGSIFSTRTALSSFARWSVHPGSTSMLGMQRSGATSVLREPPCPFLARNGNAAILREIPAPPAGRTRVTPGSAAAGGSLRRQSYPRGQLAVELNFPDDRLAELLRRGCDGNGPLFGERALRL